AGQVNGQLSDALVLRLALGVRGSRQRLGVHDLKLRVCRRKNLRAKLRAGLLEGCCTTVVLDSYAGRRMHEPPEFDRLVGLNLVLHYNLLAVQQRNSAPDTARIPGVGGG